jgi:UDP-2,3-diacylglucosamine pyrophosphatase LpxH
MVVFISDLHLTDDTACANQLPARAFRGTLADIATHAANAYAQHIALVLLGDIFDLIWTDQWFDYPMEQRPWGSQSPEAGASKILEAVARLNGETLDLLSGRNDSQFRWPAPVTRVYVPGNHDRLCNCYPSLRQRVRDLLNLEQVDPTVPFRHFFADADHGVFARHGHEWDAYNFEDTAGFLRYEYDPAPGGDYLKTPIGDAITAEVASRLWSLVLQRVPADHPDRARLGENLKNLFDVRPLVAIIPWLSYQVKLYDHVIEDAINRAIHDLAVGFRQIPFVQQWLKKHDGLRPLDEADVLKGVSWLLETFEFTRFERVLPVFEKLYSGGSHGDNLASRAAEEFQRLQRVPEWKGRIFHILYGHTHTPQQRALDAIAAQPEPRSVIYLNTGTWRSGYEQALRGTSFASWKNLTYTIVYRPGETVSRKEVPGNVAAGKAVLGYPTFETWTGGLKDF